MTENDIAEQRISQFFNSESKGYKERHENNGIPSSMEFQVESLTTEQLATVLDVGSGPGSLLLELARKSNAKLIGLDLSEEMIAVAKQRVEEQGFSDRITFKQGSFLDTDITDEVEGISLHRVLCCHPDRQGMMTSCQKLQPKIITICIPRDWKLFRGLAAIIGFFSKLFGTFRVYVHSQKSIDQRLSDMGYEIKDRLKERIWVTTTYALKE